MIIKHVSQIGEPVIRTKAKKILSFGVVKTRRMITDLKDSMRHYHLVGMAGPQIGVSLQVFVTEIRKTSIRRTKQVDPFRIFINPKVIYRSKETSVDFEGCGSVAEAQLFGPVARPAKVRIKAQDITGAWFTLTASGLLARVIQHELDHLNGIVFIDRVRDNRKLISRFVYQKQ